MVWCAKKIFHFPFPSIDVKQINVEGNENEWTKWTFFFPIPERLQMKRLDLCVNVCGVACTVGEFIYQQQQ